MPGILVAAQTACAAVALRRLARGRSRRPPLAAAPPPPSLSVVIPARDEERRIGPCLAALDGAAEVIVVDDESSDATAAVARAGGARVIRGAPLPDGWVGKQWALQQGVEAASGAVVVTLDADTRPAPGLVGALAGCLDRGADFVSAGPRFVCDTPAERLLHPAFLCTLSYRFGPLGAEPSTSAGDAQANGQCTAYRRAQFLDGGGYERVRGFMTEDYALARALAAEGWRVAFEDGADLLEVKMHDSAGELWREWGRSLAMADVLPPARRARDCAVVWACMALPVLRTAARRATPVDRALLAVRVALLLAFARFYRPRGAAFWLSPLADPLAAVRITLSSLRQTRSWRGRSYDAR
jgi:dolichol-phosphate mannosyltransferase